MATRTKLAYVLNGLVQNVDLTADELVLDSVKVGGNSGTALTKTILDGLIANSHAPMSDNQNVVAGAGLTGGGSGASPTLDVGAGDGITVNANDVAVNNTVIRTSGANAFAAAQSMGGFKLTNVADPTSDQDAATKKYVDDSITAATPAAIDVTYDNTSSGLTATNVQDAIDEVEGRLDATEIVANGAIQSTEKGANNGVATLDGGGKIPASQLPNSVMEYRGNWNASTNSPTLADGSGNAGDVYRVSVAGTQDLGSGSQSYAVGDWAVYNGSIWEKSLNSNSVVSVNGQTGIVVLDTDDISEGSNLYYTDGRFDTRFASKSTSDLAEGSNLYFTDERAQDAVGTILTDSSTIDFTYNDAGNQITADVLASPLVRKPMVAGESFAANTSFLVRLAVSGETAGRVYKASNAAAATDLKFWAIGIAHSTGAISAGQNINVVMLGSHTLGSSDTPFGGTDIGKAVWLLASGAFSVTAPTSSGEAAYKIGSVETTTSIFVDGKQLTGIN